MVSGYHPNYVLSQVAQGSEGRLFSVLKAWAGAAQMWAEAFAPKLAHSHGWQVRVDCLSWLPSTWASPYGLAFLTI